VISPDGSERYFGRSEGDIDESMDLWDHVENAVHDTSHALPANKDWLPAEVFVEITIRPQDTESDQR